MAELDPRELTKDDRIKIALAEYTEIGIQFRKLTDIRFLLLTYLPLGTVLTAVFGTPTDNVVKQRAISAFAFIVTLCIATYDKRNDQHYDELVARAAELERELQIEHGSFRYRPKSWLKYYEVVPKYRFEHVLERPRSWLKYASVPVEHRWPIGLIYAAAASLWAYLFVDAFAKENTWLQFLPSSLIWLQRGLTWLQPKLMLLKSLVPVVVFGCWKGLRSIEEAREEEQREVVKSLMEQLVGVDDSAPQDELGETIASKSILGIDEDKAKRRVKYHWKRYGERRDPRGAAALLAAVLDLPARWIEDVWSGRR